MERADSHEDIHGILAVYTNDAVWLPPNRSALRGIDLIRPNYEDLFARYDVTVEILEDEICVASPYAHCMGMTRVSLNPRDAGDPVLKRDKFLMILRHDDRWRVSHLMWSKH